MRPVVTFQKSNVARQWKRLHMPASKPYLNVRLCCISGFINAFFPQTMNSYMKVLIEVKILDKMQGPILPCKKYELVSFALDIKFLSR